MQMLLAEDLCWPIWEFAALRNKERPKEQKVGEAEVEWKITVLVFSNVLGKFLGRFTPMTSGLMILSYQWR